MDFRSATVAQQQNAKAMTYLTKCLKDPEAGRLAINELLKILGNVVDRYPDWHPILTAPPRQGREQISDLSQLKTYEELDHTIHFVRGFVTCPYSEDSADQLVKAVRVVPGLSADRLDQALYADGAYPTVVVADHVELEADGTIRSRDALAWFVQQFAGEARNAEVAETWWNIRSNLLGRPHGSRSSLFVNQQAGIHMRKILEAMNSSGMFGPIIESSLDMLPQKKRDTICETLIRAAVGKRDQESELFEFEMRGKICKASVRDTWGDDMELRVNVQIGNYDLDVSGFYYPKTRKITHTDPRGKREVAEKFL